MNKSELYNKTLDIIIEEFNNYKENVSVYKNSGQIIVNAIVYEEKTELIIDIYDKKVIEYKITVNSLNMNINNKQLTIYKLFDLLYIIHRSIHSIQYSNICNSNFNKI